MQIILDNSDKLLAILLLIIISIILRLVLEFLGQRWITTTAHTSTLVFLVQALGTTRLPQTLFLL